MDKHRIRACLVTVIQVVITLYTCSCVSIEYQVLFSIYCFEIFRKCCNICVAFKIWFIAFANSRGLLFFKQWYHLMEERQHWSCLSNCGWCFFSRVQRTLETKPAYWTLVLEKLRTTGVCISSVPNSRYLRFPQRRISLFLKVEFYLLTSCCCTIYQAASFKPRWGFTLQMSWQVAGPNQPSLQTKALGCMPALPSHQLSSQLATRWADPWSTVSRKWSLSFSSFFFFSFLSWVRFNPRKWFIS